MHPRNPHPTTFDLTRAKRYFEARDVDPEALARVQREIAVELLGPEVAARDTEVGTFSQHRCLSSFEATQTFAKEFERALTWCASKIGAKPPKSGKYDPLFSTPTMFRDIWHTRQVADELGITYGFYSQNAVEYWTGQGETRMPRPGQLCSPAVIEHVVKKWSDMRSGVSPDGERANAMSLDQPNDDMGMLDPDPQQALPSRWLTTASATTDIGSRTRSASDEALKALIAAEAANANR